MFSARRAERLPLHRSGIAWSKEECRNGQIYCSCLTAHFAKAMRDMFLLARGGVWRIFEPTARLFRTLNCIITENARCATHYRLELSFKCSFYECPKGSSLKCTLVGFAFSEPVYNEVILLDSGNKGIPIILRLFCCYNCTRREIIWSITSGWMRRR